MENLIKIISEKLDKQLEGYNESVAQKVLAEHQMYYMQGTKDILEELLKELEHGEEGDKETTDQPN